MCTLHLGNALQLRCSPFLAGGKLHLSMLLCVKLYTTSSALLQAKTPAVRNCTEILQGLAGEGKAATDLIAMPRF